MPVVARLGFSLIRHIDDRQSSTPAIIVGIILIFGLGLGTHYLADSLTKCFLKYREAKVLLVERKQPILTGTMPNQQTLSDSKKVKLSFSLGYYTLFILKLFHNLRKQAHKEWLVFCFFHYLQQ